ncbi:type IV-A pilus assembly ATPase PilB [Thiolapillus brandeum]|uniref:Type IV pilus assembly protein PilB n=1 Tax=Thiolapillus brandeum TaxID=1076588 RepID=A0A7U6JGI8_9GAMM|nr:type IV-A pilus assembly ATPase PilB [Thiolapillus brandeum]BAO43521.1 type IV pilus assembly protein PilB [Thiolapillus brandeum]
MNEDSNKNLKGFSRYLVNAGLLELESALEAEKKAKDDDVPLITHVVRTGLVPSRKIALLAHQEFGLPLLDLDALSKDSLAVNEVEPQLFNKHHVLPLVRRGNRLFLAASDPTNQEAIKEIQFSTGLAIEIILVEEEKLASALEDASKSQEAAMGAMLEENLENIDFGLDGEGDIDEEGQAEIDEAPVVRFVNKILLDAINSGVSDIHFEPYEKSYRIRYRQDGLLFEKASPPVNIAQRLSSRLKVMARLNIAERRVPQDGRIKLKVSKHQAIDFRVNTCPTVYGEKVVLRILDASAATLGVDALGFEEDQKELFLKAIKKPYGMILVTGPTGSGKTVSLYTALNILNSPEVNISTAEDPVEIQVEGINQVNINTASGLHFADALRAFLRQDPDIIMVGEIRDLETGEIAVKAAQTGHMVLSTLHTNDAPQTLTRMANMGIPPYNIASSVNLIMAQRLGRRLCDHCKEVEDLPRTALLEEGFSEAEVASGLTIYKAVGCDKCNNGYKGRVGIFEILPVSEGIAQIILEEGNAMQLKDQALKEGYYYDLRTAGLLKVKNGITSLEEINRITKD